MTNLGIELLSQLKIIVKNYCTKGRLHIETWGLHKDIKDINDNDDNDEDNNNNNNDDKDNSNKNK